MTRSALSGRRGVTTVATLSAVLMVVVAGQVHAASTPDGPLAPASRPGVLVPAFGPSPAPATQLPELYPASAAQALRPPTTSTGDRLPGPIRDSGPVPAAARPAPAGPATAPAPAPEKEAAAPASLCSGPGWQARRGEAALASLRGGAARTGFRVEFQGARKGYMGLTHLEERRIEVFVRACGTQSDELLRHVVAHELGHAYDTTHMSTATRRAWMAARGIPVGTNWYGCSGCTDFATPAGDFAEVYAQWARGTSTNRSELAGDVPAGQLAALAAQFFGA